ncbi:hypothetical protein ISN44_As06g046210 [Arabidopsis suecica]|uniref:Uncharacterized protein n=1 Tax=Arabidopsis suecica TaxID=45249 RepID=A0A8T2CM33_ARASU|nr:hypothetical protein ISN44_As06g046210 [Arabidopsis suecica]
MRQGQLEGRVKDEEDEEDEEPQSTPLSFEYFASWDKVKDGPKKRELEKTLKKMQAKQAELCMIRIELVADAAKVMFKQDNASSSGK